jgi:hypothetical protein
LECLGIDKELKASAKISATKTTNVWGVQQHSIFYQWESSSHGPMLLSPVENLWIFLLIIFFEFLVRGK